MCAVQGPGNAADGGDDHANDEFADSHRFFAESRADDGPAACPTPTPRPCPPGRHGSSLPSRPPPRRWSARGILNGARRPADCGVTRVNVAKATRLLVAGMALFLVTVVRLHVMVIEVGRGRSRMVLRMDVDERFLDGMNTLASP